MEFTLKYDGRLKSPYDDVVFAVGCFFEQWDPSAVTPIWGVRGAQGNHVEKKVSFGHIP